MWISKIEFDGSSCLLGKICTETKTSIRGYPLNNNYKNNEFNVTIIGTIDGEKNAIDNFIKYIKNLSTIKNFDVSGNLFICEFKEKKELQKIYKAEIIFFLCRSSIMTKVLLDISSK